MATRTNGRIWHLFNFLLVTIILGWTPFVQAEEVPEPLLIPVGVPETVGLPDHVVVKQLVRVNQRAMRSPVISIQLPDGTIIIADRKNEVVDALPGQRTWIGDVREAQGEVIVTARGAHFSAVIDYDQMSYEISRAVGGRGSIFELIEIELGQLPIEDFGGVPDGDGQTDPSAGSAEALAENVVQDLLVVYNQKACDRFGGCGQMQTNIINAVAAMNTAYAESGINITSNLVGMALTSYSGTSTSQALSDLRGTTDGNMDEVHQLRDQLGADLVAMVHDGDGCGIGYLGSSASTAFTVTNYSCLGGNRTLSHELGHNQGAHHDRLTVGTTSTTAYNFGYRRCSDATVDNVGSPYFRTIMSYSCGYSRVGRYSNPNINYSGVPQGVDPAQVTDLSVQQGGAWNARTLNESASYVAGFRQAASTEPPQAPGSLSATAQGSDSILISWHDNSNDETGFVLQTAATNSLDDSDWSELASLGAELTSYTHTGLNPESTHWYRVQAYNSAGSSDFSNTGSATTQALPIEIPDLALTDNFGRGSVSGTYFATHAAGGDYQTITEAHTGGRKKSRKQSYNHSWDFDVYGGVGGVMMTVSAWVSGSEGANFWYSTDGGATTVPMMTFNNTTPGTTQTFMLPGETSGNVLIGVGDAEQRNGEAVDSVYVDFLVITSYTDPVDPPTAPSGLTAGATTSNSVILSFSDNAVDEWGFEVRNGSCEGELVATLDNNESTGNTTYLVDGLNPGTFYELGISAFNGGGNSLCSNFVALTTDPEALVLTVEANKTKGKHAPTLTWTPTESSMDVYLDGGLSPIAEGRASGWSYNTSNKGGGTYTFKVCLADTLTCSEPVTVRY